MFHRLTQSLAESDPTRGSIFTPAPPQQARSSSPCRAAVDEYRSGKGPCAWGRPSWTFDGMPARPLEQLQAVNGSLPSFNPVAQKRIRETRISTHHRCALKDHVPTKTVPSSSNDGHNGARVGLQQVCVQITQGHAKGLQNNPSRTHASCTRDSGRSRSIRIPVSTRACCTE